MNKKAVLTRVKVGNDKITCERGLLTVPEDWSTTGSRKIQLPFLLLRSKVVSTSSPVFLLGGGPGVSNLYVDHLGAFLQETRDVVYIGYRGADGESRTPFPAFRRAVNKFDFQRPEVSFGRMRQAFEAECLRMEERGYTPKHYNIANVIEDLEFARVQLGYQAIDVISGSYGTRLAFLWSVKYPKSLS